MNVGNKLCEVVRYFHTLTFPLYVFGRSHRGVSLRCWRLQTVSWLSHLRCDSVEGLNGRRGEWNKPSRPHLMLHQLCGYTHLRWSHALWQETEGSRAQWAPAKRPCWALREGSPQARPGIGITYLGWHAVPTATRDSAIRTHALTGVPLTSANIRPPPH